MRSLKEKEENILMHRKKERVRERKRLREE